MKHKEQIQNVQLKNQSIAQGLIKGHCLLLTKKRKKKV